MKCQFCPQECDSVFSEDFEVCSWYTCSACNVIYRTFCVGGKLDLIRFPSSFRNHDYCIDLDMNKQVTEIVSLPKNFGEPAQIIVSFPYILPGLTPDNIKSKLETYINFS